MKSVQREQKLRRFESLWKEYFRDPSQWRDNRSSKIGAAYPDFKHRVTNEPLWLDGKYNPSWVAEELNSRGLAMPIQGKNVEDCPGGSEALSNSDECNTLIALLRSCAKDKDLSRGIQAHDDILRRGLLENCSDALITMYAKCGKLAQAKELLDTHKSRDVISWTALIAGYAQQGQSLDALKSFEQMQHEGLSPDWVTFTCALKACGNVRASDKGEQIHHEIARQGLLGKNIVLDTAVVDMYAKCGALTKAQEVLEGLPARNVVCWSSLISGYAQDGQSEHALECFEKMQKEGIAPNAVTYTSVLKACGDLGAAYMGEQIHDEVRRQGLLKKDMVLGTALVDMYAKCGQLVKAQRLLERLTLRDVVTWNALLVGYSQQCQAEKAMECFSRMQREGITPNAVSFSCILKACGSIGAISKGEEIHNKIASEGLLENNIILGNAVIDMYAKCGALAKARQVLEELPCRDVASWNSLMTGCTQQGQCSETINCFKLMQDERIAPNAVSFSCVLNACSHLGMVDDGQSYFVIMTEKYGLKPDIEHYTCLVDLFGRAGHLDKGIELTQLMPSMEDSAIWCCLLGASRKWRDVDVGRYAFQRAIDRDKSDPAAYILMANIYAAAGMQEEAETIEAMRIENKAWKIPGCCWWVDAMGHVHRFYVGDTEHSQSKEIYAKLKDIDQRFSEAGHSPSLHWVSANISADAKVESLCGHSEKLALACALINSHQGESIHIVKNLRVCGDCHSVTALISKLEKRRIIIRDANRCHEFDDGKCSCGDFTCEQ